MSDQKTYRVFVLNPGSTSTKLEYFENEKSIKKDNIFHDSTVLRNFDTINAQLYYRMEYVRKWLAENNIDLTGIDAIVGRGGACYPVPSGTYEVDERLLNDVRSAKGGVYHSSMLGIQMAKELHDEFGGRLLMVDPIVVDELQDVARITGVKGLYRTSATHALNLKATAREHAKRTGVKYKDMNYIVCHIDGGITVTAHQKGRMIDANDGSGGDGPFTPTRMGTMAVTDVIKFLFDKPLDEVRKLCQSTGGLSSWFGTSNSDTIHELVEKGDPKATLIWNALIYQITKLIGSMACVLHGQVDAIILTGGLMRFDDVLEGIKEACSWIAPVFSYPGELEHEAMRDGALRVLRGEEEALIYPGKPVFSGFDFDK
ncbi:MAG: butyrate kinase [Clostridiales bacterium]|nr:butyrate kinase [Clostridiales bacterium]